MTGSGWHCLSVLNPKIDTANTGITTVLGPVKLRRQKSRFAPLFDQPLIGVMPCRQGDRAPCPVALLTGLAILDMNLFHQVVKKKQHRRAGDD